jgi:hypothetical protein
MRNILTLVLVFTSLITSAQMIVDLPINNVLYRGYSNYIESYGDSFGKSVRLTTEKSDSSLAITKSGKGWIVKTRGQNKTVTLCLVTEKNDTILRNKYVILPLPGVELKWSIKTKDNRFHAVPGDSLFAEIDLAGRYLKYHVDQWSISASRMSKSFAGSGSKLTNEVIEFINSLPNGSEIYVSAMCSGKGMAFRSVAATFGKSNFFTKERLLAKTNRFFVIDKTPENAALFDPSNPSSLIAFGKYAFEKNGFRFYLKGIEDSLVDYFKKESNQISRYSESRVIPMLDENGENVTELIFDEAIGDSVALYKTIGIETSEYADFQDITRIICFQKEVIDTLNGKSNFVLDKVAFAKKVPNLTDKYIITFSIQFDESSSSDSVSYNCIIMFDQTDSKGLLNRADKNSLISKITSNKILFRKILIQSINENLIQSNNELFIHSKKEILIQSDKELLKYSTGNSRVEPILDENGEQVFEFKYDAVVGDSVVFYKYLTYVIDSSKVDLTSEFSEILDTLTRIGLEKNPLIELYPQKPRIDSTKYYYVLSFGSGQVKLAFTKEQLFSIKNARLTSIINEFEKNRTINETPRVKFMKEFSKNSTNKYFYPGDSNEDLLNTYYINQYVPLNDYYFGQYFR